MKSIQHLVTLLALASVSFTACKKEKIEDTDPPNPDFVLPVGEAAKILGKWQIKTITINDHYAGADHIKTYQGTSADYVEFRTDGKMHTFFNGSLDVSNYTVKSTKQITIDTDPATILLMTDTQLKFSSKDETGTFGFTEIIYDLMR